MKRLDWRQGRILASVLSVMLVSVVLGTSAPSSAASGLFEVIKRRGSVVVATEAASYPFEFIEDGKIVGYNKEILDQIIKAWGVKLVQLDLPFAGILPGLLQRKYDFVATNLLITPERAEKYAFTMPTAAVDMAMLKRKGDGRVRSVADLAGLIVGVPIPPSAPYTVFEKYNDELKASGKAAADVKLFPSSPDMFVALANRQIDVAVLHVPGLLGAMRRLPDIFEMVGRFGTRFWTGWVTRPVDTDLRAAINVEVRKLRDSGELVRLQTKWFGYTMQIPDSGYLPPGAK